MNNSPVWNFHSSKSGPECTKAEMQFPHPLFLKGWKFIFAHSGVVEISGGRPVEISGNTRRKRLWITTQAEGV